ncbi:MAG: CYTH domain-containing protein [Bacteroidales bacterium]|jgi:adenylate cyclase|nr:CYTH domain-containing protein [Bacteroidales bacterium]
MGKETERKFLIRGEFRILAYRHSHISQGYLSTVPGRTVRIRITEGKGFLTVKGPADDNGLTRYEWEKEISLKDAEDLLKLCEPGIIEKTRYYIRHEGFIIEADVFHGDNEGLLMAEVELENESDSFPLPQWFGEEVTGNPKYYNSFLRGNPYKNWK